MSGAYGYALTKDGVIVGGGSKRYHCIHQLQDNAGLGTYLIGKIK